MTILPSWIDVVDVALVEVVRLQRVVDQVRPLHVAGSVEALYSGEFFRLAHALVGEIDVVLFLFDLEVDVFLQLPRDLVCPLVLRDVVFSRTRNDQRRTGLVDEDIVDLVDDGVVQPSLGLLVALRIAVVATGGDPHVVAKVVEAEFVVRAIRDVASVRILSFTRIPCQSKSHRPSGPNW